MKIRNLGRTGLKVSNLCLGAMTFGNSDWGCDEPTSARIVHQFLDHGGNFIDTADAYSIGVSEEITGRAIADRRSSVVIATKVLAPMGTSPNDRGLSRKHILDAVDASLKRLQVDYIDLYQVHGFDEQTPIDETLRALDDCVRSGRVRYIGCSNHFAWQLMKAIALSSELGVARYDCLQPNYSLVTRAIEREMLPLCIDQGVGVIPYSPLAGGILTGKMRPGQEPPAGTRAALNPFGGNFYTEERKLAIAQEVIEVAEQVGATPSQVALSWCANQPGITSPIFGARTIEQLEDNLGAADLDLDDETNKRLDKASRLELEYPADILAMFRRRAAEAEK
ncbi:MAG: aldo/keto reductase [Gammaproteobacteria bacterium]|nr:aldo/keto reductase [Gammaproteobacteria bacterium]